MCLFKKIQVLLVLFAVFNAQMTSSNIEQLDNTNERQPPSPILPQNQLMMELQKKIDKIARQSGGFATRKEQSSNHSPPATNSKPSTNKKNYLMIKGSKQQVEPLHRSKIPDSLLKTIQDKRSIFKAYSMSTDDVMETIDLQLENLFFLSRLKFLRKSASFKRRSGYYLMSVRNLYNILPNNRLEQKSQTLYVVEIGYIDNSFNILTSQNTALSDMINMERNSLIIDYLREKSESRQTLLTMDSKAHQLINQAITKAYRLITLINIDSLSKNRTLTDTYRSIQQLGSKVTALNRSIIQSSPYLDASEAQETKAAQQLFKFKRYSEDLFRDIDKMLVNLEQKYDDNEVQMYTVINEYISKRNDFKQLNNAFKSLNRMHSKLTTKDRLIGQRESAILMKYNSYQNALNRIKSIKNRFEVHNDTIFKNIIDNIDLSFQIVDVLDSIKVKVRTLINTQRRDSNIQSILAQSSSLEQAIKSCQELLMKIAQTVKKLDGLSYIISADDRAAYNLAFMTSAQQQNDILGSYLKDLTAQSLKLDGDIQSPNFNKFITLVSNNYTALTQSMDSKLANYQQAFSEVNNRLDRLIDSIQDRYNSKIMNSYRLFRHQIEKKQKSCKSQRNEQNNVFFPSTLDDQSLIKQTEIIPNTN